MRTDGPFVLRSGLQSSWYIDARRTTFDGVGARLVGKAVVAVLDPEVAAVGGMTMGADPIAVAAAVAAVEEGRPLRAFSIRKEAKAHGTGGRLVGAAQPGDVACLVEDTTTTGSALLEALAVAEESGLRVVQAIALVDRSGGAVAAALEERAIAYRALVTPSALGVE